MNEETMNTNGNINNDKIIMKFQSINEQYPNSNLSQSSNIINNEETIFQVNQQQQYWQPFPRPISIEKHRNSSILTNPRKSLAMIFSQISNNLGLTQETLTEYPNEHYSPNFRLNTRIPSGKRLKQIITKHNTNNSNNDNSTNYDNAIFNPDAETHKKSSRSSFIQQHKDFNLDNNNNNTIGIRSSISSQRLMERNIFNTIIGGNPNQHRTSGSLSNIHYNKSNNPNTILTSNSNNNTMSPTTTTMDRSILVDLLCCTCCTNSDDEDEAYSNLIENHRLARIVTMGAILTILGLIFAYIIRSATETQTVPNTSSTTGSPPSSPTTTTLTMTTTVANVTDIETYSSFSNTTNNTLNLIMNSSLNPQFIKQMRNFSSLFNLTHNDESNSVRILNDSYVYNHVNSKLISTNEDNNNES